MYVKKILKNSMDMVHNMNVLDVTVFKLTVFTAALLIAKLFPIVLDLNIWVYIAVWAGGAVYLLKNMSWK